MQRCSRLGGLLNGLKAAAIALLAQRDQSLYPQREHRTVRSGLALLLALAATNVGWSQEHSSRRTANHRAERAARSTWSPVRPSSELPPDAADAKRSRVALAAAQEEIIPGDAVESVLQPIPHESVEPAPLASGSQPAHDTIIDTRVGEPMFVGEDLSCDAMGCDDPSCGLEGSCNRCGHPGYGLRRCFCLWLPSDGWFQGEYLNWWQSGMAIPPLVTTSPGSPTLTPRSTAGVLGQNTSILYGDEDIFTDSRDGGRLRAGLWLDACHKWALQGEYFALSSDTEEFSQTSTGNPILARPFFNALTGREDSELVAYPGVVSGTVSTRAITRLQGASAHLRRQLCCTTGCGVDLCGRSIETGHRIDAIIGWRYLGLRESLEINEDLVGAANEPGSFDIVDRFDTRTRFNGVDFGLVYGGRRGRWTGDLIFKLGLGNNRQDVTIFGETSTTENNVRTTRSGGLLAQRSNIGVYSRDVFAVVPELGATIGYQLTPRLRATVGYTFIYWSNVVRPGDQVDLDVNPNLLPPEADPFSGPLRPQFDLRETNFWVQGISFGGEYRW
jgi:hypothetical protein